MCRARFVRRQAEKTLFRQALLAEQPPFVVLHIHEPGGVGKLTLLRELERVAEESGWAAVRIDGHNVEPTPSGLLPALPYATGLNSDDGALRPPIPARCVLIIDTCELLEALDPWLRETFIPALPSDDRRPRLLDQPSPTPP